MSFEQDWAHQQAENREIIEALLDDGSDPDALYTIEHHFSAQHFGTLEKAAVEMFKQGYEVTDAEELALDDGAQLVCFDVIIERPLQVEAINQDCEKLMKLAEKLGIAYDSWGTYFMDPDGEAEEA
ncbi:ribonuclease E inhibitor RraB [Paraferrimonas sedimenticola]|uniref:Regulator of ribonuclease activity B n=1 Tax=Paraferrimonas sedimenticola TaxID=375674 RepID=A0AA37VZI3_9GAMM|nr:ribonuclease E inhibitor RraB [Paraferrimonas sedimenticola]GLP97224.1 regulator of ribonuclease activity B [Paraferrimonas sedimenticola]